VTVLSYKLYATCPNEITEILAGEIESIGGTEISTSYRVVYFTASEEVYYKAHLHLRLASRICRILKDIPAHSPRIIFDKTRRIRFHEYFSPDLPVTINVAASSKDSSIPGHLIGSKIREAISDSFKHHCDKSPNLSARDAKVSINAFFHDNRLMLSLDTALNSLHRRGFRVEGHPAPLKETVAASLLRICEYDGDTPLYDPMCGSGNIVVEGAQIATRKAALIDRGKGEFGFEHLKDFNSKLWISIKEEARNQQIPAKFKIYGSDIDASYVDIAKESALKAGIEKHVQFGVKDFFKTDKPSETGVLIANLPYGQRLEGSELSKEYFRSIGDHLKGNFKGWKCALLVPEDSLYKEIGLKPDKRMSLLNGKIKVKFLIFNIY